MTYKTFTKKLKKLNFTVEQLEPDELDVISLDTSQVVPNCNFPKEFACVYLDCTRQFFIGHLVSDKLFLVVKHFADTPIKNRHISKSALR